MAGIDDINVNFDSDDKKINIDDNILSGDANIDVKNDDALYGVDLLASEEVLVSSCWEPIAVIAAKKGADIHYGTMKEGHQTWNNVWMLTKGGKQKVKEASKLTRKRKIKENKLIRRRTQQETEQFEEQQQHATISANEDE